MSRVQAASINQAITKKEEQVTALHSAPSGREEITIRNPDPPGMTYPFRTPPKKEAVPYYMCPEHGVQLSRGAWVRMVMELRTGITRLHFICEFLERVTVEEHPDNTVIYHRAPRIRPKTRRSPPTALIPFDTDRHRG